MAEIRQNLGDHQSITLKKILSLMNVRIKIGAH